MFDRLTAAIRTAVVVTLTGWLMAFASWALQFDIVVDSAIVEEVVLAVATLVMAVVVGVINFVLAWAQEKWPWLGQIVSLGRTTAVPVYRPPEVGSQSES